MTDFYDLKFRDENAVVSDLLAIIDQANLDDGQIEQHAKVFIECIRERHRDVKGFNALMQSYDLTSKEGLALMTMAEALLRIPDKATINALIEDKLSEGDWSALFDHAQGTFGKLSGMGLSLSQKVMVSMVGRLGMPVIRKACVEAMQLMGKTFVLGRTIEEAIQNAKTPLKNGVLYNFDMLGEGARTHKDADFYFDAYAHAIRMIGQSVDSRGKDILSRSGISVKLSALYPKYDYAHKDKAVPFLTDRLVELCAIAAEYRLNLTVDAEECDRLAVSLEIIYNALKNPVMKNWHGFGLAVQAYQKRAYPLIEKIIGWVQEKDQKISIRLVKGAYWDTEIKHAQIEGHAGYPVFTRKENTDLSYLACAKLLLDHRDHVKPMFGTHNAHTVAAIMQMAGNDKDGLMFQRLHGMGEQLFNQIHAMDYPVCVYAPVGTHQYLLAYLVRRLLENGANSSFVNQIYDPNVSADLLAENPIAKVRSNEGNHHHDKIPLPKDIYSTRQNSIGFDLSEDNPLRSLMTVISNNEDTPYDAPCIIDGDDVMSGYTYTNTNPSNKDDKVGDVFYARNDHIQLAFSIAQKGFMEWNKTDIETRASVLNTIADLYEDNCEAMMALLIREAGKTISDAIAEVREAVDFCRYYAVEAEKHFKEIDLEGPTGERNSYCLEGRGVFVCISPWNFPLAIFTGQIVAALVAGNAVIAKPAEQTPAIAVMAIKLMLKAGIPKDVLHLLQGAGDIGGRIIDHQGVAGVAFTGSTDVAKLIQRQLADKDGAIIPLIAETGGVNAMIVDSTALPEQVTDDVLHSAFGSAGQRCSALRVVCIQDDVADEIIPMIKGAMDCLEVGDPQYLSTDVGPIIDDEAKANLVDYHVSLEGRFKHLHETPFDSRLDGFGTYFTPVAVEIDSIDDVEKEAFGPILHILRYKEHDLDDLLKSINAKGYGLTFGLHSRIFGKQQKLAATINAGNIYINRGQTGAVVGVQPFGGRGLSGTGPKAGGPHYLPVFATEKSISDNITASGGNAFLVNL
jgi:RHH-type proline utilization regulon transcriptional repressor/proline dehydrogenase/delta 1-pyrroline-5-carboxylate dehydrogenase